VNSLRISQLNAHHSGNEDGKIVKEGDGGPIMSTQTIYPNARSAAYAVKRVMDSTGMANVTARPWNKFDPDNTFWWLVPDTVWPAFNHGKLFFSPDRAPKGHLFCGLHIEKGLDQSVSEAYPSRAGKRLIMSENWIWHRFLEDLRSGAVDSALRQASQKIGGPLLIRLEAGYVEDPGSFDPQAVRFKWDKIVFSSRGGSLKVESSDTPSRFLGDIAELRKPEDLAGAIDHIQNAGWFWIDAFIGSLFERAADPVGRAGWDAEDLWIKSLCMWEPWFINRLEIVLTMGSPSTPPSPPIVGGEGKGEGASGCQNKYETINK
jgi:hypothetical protein